MTRRLILAVRIRMKRFGRHRRPFYRICAVDSRSPRDGKVIEELGIYDPMVRETDARTAFNVERMQYWVGVGALPSDQVRVLWKKYGPGGTHEAQMNAAKAKLSGPREVPPAPEAVVKWSEKKKKAEEAAAAASAPAESAPPAEGADAAEPAEVPAE